jgi:hypothetical protein
MVVGMGCMAAYTAERHRGWCMVVAYMVGAALNMEVVGGMGVWEYSAKGRRTVEEEVGAQVLPHKGSDGAPPR